MATEHSEVTSKHHQVSRDDRKQAFLFFLLFGYPKALTCRLKTITRSALTPRNRSTLTLQDEQAAD
jgi:hypothetical protein